MWKPKAGFSKKGFRRREHRCPYRGKANCNCPAVIRESVDEFGQYTLERKQAAPHADHSISNKVRGLPVAPGATG